MTPPMLAVVNETMTDLTNYVMIGFSVMKGINTAGFVGTELSITINSTLIPTQATYSAPTVSATPVSEPMGYAVYVPAPQILTYPITATVCGLSTILALEKPLPTTLQIRGYSIYSYNGSALTSCTLAKPITVNPTSINYLFLPPASEPFKISLSMNEFIFNIATCTVDYWFPTNIVQLPYGYVTIVTNIGNITVQLLPRPTSIIIGSIH